MTRTVEEAARILMAKLRVVHGHRTMDDDDAGAILAALREARDAALHEAANHLDRIAPYAEDQQTTFNAQGCAREVRLLASSPPPAAPSQETETRGCLCSRDNGGVPRSGNTFHSATCCDLRGEGIGEATTNDGMRILESLFAQAEATSAPSAAPDTAGCPTCGTCSGGGICQCEDIRCPCWRASPGAGGADEGSAT
jgi:hypothetical protein